jgi:hypothetical protein
MGPHLRVYHSGEIGPFGAAVRSESLAAILQRVYRDETDSDNPDETPPYLRPDSVPAWTADYPERFRELQALVLSQRTALGHESHISYDFLATANDRNRSFRLPTACYLPEHSRKELYNQRP